VTSTTVYSEKLLTPNKWCTTSPFMSLNLLVPSLGMPYWNLLPNLLQLLLFVLLQSLHSPQFGRNTGTTNSPSFTSSTCSPTLSTTLTRDEVQIRKITINISIILKIIFLKKKLPHGFVS
jgi:hypothetical protein